MRSFNCHYYRLLLENKKKILSKNSVTVCWSGLHHFLKDNSIDYIYIDSFVEELTKKNIRYLLNLINQITPCKLATVNKKQYIKYKLLKRYDNDLVLLNFIRNLWNAQPIYHLTKKNANVQESKEAGENYIKHFFITLRSNRKLYKDALERLTHANFEACKIVGTAGSIGHSNIHNINSLKIKNTQQLLENSYTATQFMTIN